MSRSARYQQLLKDDRWNQRRQGIMRPDGFAGQPFFGSCLVAWGESTRIRSFARLAMKRLVYEARKESQKNKSH